MISGAAKLPSQMNVLETPTSQGTLSSRTMGLATGIGNPSGVMSALKNLKGLESARTIKNFESLKP
jgi:tetraacyldisaccharide-1-P 4'-kinase